MLVWNCLRKLFLFYRQKQQTIQSCLLLGNMGLLSTRWRKGEYLPELTFMLEFFNLIFVSSKLRISIPTFAPTSIMVLPNCKETKSNCLIQISMTEILIGIRDFHGDMVKLWSNEKWYSCSITYNKEWSVDWSIFATTTPIWVFWFHLVGGMKARTNIPKWQEIQMHEVCLSNLFWNFWRSTTLMAWILIGKTFKHLWKKL